MLDPGTQPSSLAPRFVRAFNGISGVYPAIRSADYVVDLREMMAFKDARRSARTIAARADDGSRTIRVQAGNFLLESRERRIDRAGNVAVVVLAVAAHVHQLKVCTFRDAMVKLI